MSMSMAAPPIKRQKRTHHHDHQPLIPGLPDDIAHVCLSNVHCPSLVFSVCKSWRRLIYSPSFPPFLSLYTTLLPTTNSSSDSLHFSAYDPLSSKWEPLPPPPPNQPLVLHHHPSFLSRKLPIQTVSVSGYLVLLAATTHNFNPALSRPLLFNPVLCNWVFGPHLLAPRRWCAAGSVGHTVYVASGIGSHFSSDVARSVEKWDLRSPSKTKRQRRWGWERMEGRLKDGRFSRDAVDAVGWRGRLCMVNIKGDAAKEGLVYDVEKDTWRYMPEGMLKGWRGPVAAMDEEVLYTVDETTGVLRKYHQECDCWVDVVSSRTLVGAQQMTAARGKVCVVCEKGGIVVVDVTAAPPRIWLLDTPTGFQALTIHILPRMSRPLSS